MAMENGMASRPAGRMGRRGFARVRDGVVVCPRHGRMLARVTAQGLCLWCKGPESHPVLLDQRTLRALLDQAEKSGEQ